ncbi:hypothetical protein Talka_00735 [Tepidimonas alkaliphilus]|uniref:Uncharacterized protein n=1 Tax=Tepidimonas alkaliphilus TaxID=2588942 RepID=A0A554WA17_9BURK|nr:hypothetical protein Talka_00735 [Tepidimonas alkaliphilus]
MRRPIDMQEMPKMSEMLWAWLGALAAVAIAGWWVLRSPR